MNDIDTAVSNITSPPGAAEFMLEASPIHYIVKIKSFSLLTKNAMEKYESGVFEAGGYHWKLVLYPNGNKSSDVKDHISLYLSMADTVSLPLDWELHATFRLFLLNQKMNNYRVIEEKERWFHGLKLEWGFDHFIQLSTFNEARNGFLVEDTCVLGAEVFVQKERSRGKGEVLSMVEEPVSFKCTWEIENFSKLDDKRQESQIFSMGNRKWKIQLYPKGYGFGTGTHLSLYLALDSADLPAGCRLYTEYTLRIVDQGLARQVHCSEKAKRWFSALSPEGGWSRFFTLDRLHHPSTELVVKDVCIVEAEIMIHATSAALQGC